MLGEGFTETQSFCCLCGALLFKLGARYRCFVPEEFPSRPNN